MSQQFSLFDDDAEFAGSEVSESTDADAAARRILELRAELERHRELYYNQSRTEISDTEYDFLEKELERLEAEHPELVSAESPSVRVGGAPSDSLSVVRHEVPMLSIQNVYEGAGVLDFARDAYKKIPAGEEIAWVLELKIDGVALALHYVDGVLVQGVTRGDGKKGNDVTHNVRTIADVPAVLRQTDPRYPVPPRLEVRGEVYMTNSGLEELNRIQSETGGVLYANPRNAASGSVQLKDPQICAGRHLRMFCHSVGDTSALPCRTHTEFLEAARSWGLVPTPDVLHFARAEEAVAWCEENQERLFDHDFESDGFVLKVDSFRQRALIGQKPKFPKWMIALKFKKYEAATRLLNIRVQVGKSGVITPVADLEPVELAGTMVARSSLHNAEEIRRKDIRIGDWVVVEKAGKIIPHVVRAEIHRRECELPLFAFPSACPECGAPLAQDEGGVYIRCSNLQCPARWEEKILYFATRNAMDIKGLGDKICRQLLARGLVRTFADLYRLSLADLLTLERTGAKLATNLLDSISASRGRGLARLLNALSIPHLGAETAALIALRFRTFESLVQADPEQIAQVDGVGEIIAHSVHRYLHEQGGAEAVRDLQSVGVVTDFVDEYGILPPDADAAASSEAPLSGMAVVATGKLERFTREEIEAYIRRLGGKPTSSVSQRTAFLVHGADPGSKLDRARELGVKTLDEREFVERFGDAGLKGAAE